MEDINKLVTSLELLTADNAVGAFIMDKFFHVVWKNSAVDAFFPECEVGLYVPDFARALDVQQFASQAVTMSTTETVTKNTAGNRVVIFMIHCSGYFACLVSSGFQVGNIAVGTLIHDIKSPISIVKQAAAAVSFCKTEAQKSQLSDIIQRNCSKAIKMADDLLTLWYQNDLTGCFERKFISARDIVALLCEDIEASIQRIPLKLITEIDLDGETVFADKDAIERIILNILCNSIRYAKTCIKIRAFCSDSAVHISIENDGQPVCDKEDVFNLFVKDKSGGHGMGLYISRIIADAHDGALVCKDSALGGAAFELTLPVSHSLCVKALPVTKTPATCYAKAEIEAAVEERINMKG